MSRRGVPLFAWVVLVACATSPLVAHEGATGIVKERMDQMKEIGRAVKRINDRVKSRRDLAGIAADAERIRVAAQRMPSLFPEGSIDEHSEAKADIWKRWAQFNDDAKALERNAEALKQLAASAMASELDAKLRAVNGTCTACHNQFRVRR